MPEGHVMLPPDQLNNRKFFKFHNATSHSTNECRIFRQHIQRAIQQGRLKFDTPRKMKVDDNPFPRYQNMVDARLLKGKTKVLTSTKSREAGAVDPEMQISADEYREIRRQRKKICLAGRPMVSKRFDKKPKEKGAMPRISSGIQ